MSEIIATPNKDLELLPLTSAVYIGDAYELIRRVPEGSVRLCLSDPPYNITRKNNFHTMGRRGIEFKWDGSFDQVSWLPLVAETIMPWGSIVIFNDWKNLGDIAKALTKLGFLVKRDLIWSKTNPKPANRDRVFVQTREYALWAVKKGKSGKKHPKWVFNRRPGNGMERGEFFYPVQKKSIHPTKKPDGLFAELIEILSNKDDLILDPFAGVGTMAYAAEKMGRKHISFELDPEYGNQAIAHWQEAK